MKGKVYFKIGSIEIRENYKNRISAQGYYDKGLCCFQSGEMKRTYVKFMLEHFPLDPVTKIFPTLKKHFILTGNNIRQICEYFSILTPGFQKYVEKYYPESFFAMKELINIEKQWLITFVHPFCDENFPVAATDEILAFIYPL